MAKWPSLVELIPADLLLVRVHHTRNNLSGPAKAGRRYAGDIQRRKAFCHSIPGTVNTGRRSKHGHNTETVLSNKCGRIGMGWQPSRNPGSRNPYNLEPDNRLDNIDSHRKPGRDIHDTPTPFPLRPKLQAAIRIKRPLHFRRYRPGLLPHLRCRVRMAAA